MLIQCGNENARIRLNEPPGECEGINQKPDVNKSSVQFVSLKVTAISTTIIVNSVVWILVSGSNDNHFKESFC